MDEDLNFATEIKDNVLPLILELYLGILRTGGKKGDKDDDDKKDD
jgi:hypothetical protein